MFFPSGPWLVLIAVRDSHCGDNNLILKNLVQLLMAKNWTPALAYKEGSML